MIRSGQNLILPRLNALMEEGDTPNQNNLSGEVYVRGSIKFGNRLIFDVTPEGEITAVDDVPRVGESGNIRGDEEF